MPTRYGIALLAGLGVLALSAAPALAAPNGNGESCVSEKTTLTDGQGRRVTCYTKCTTPGGQKSGNVTIGPSTRISDCETEKVSRPQIKSNQPTPRKPQQSVQ